MAPSLQSVDAPDRLRLERVDPFAGGDWDEAVQRHPGHSVFHRSAWARVLVEAYGHRPHCLRFVDEQGAAALIPLLEVRSLLTGTRVVSLPFSDFAGPLLRDGADEGQVFEMLAEIAASGDWKHLELRAGPSTAFSLPVHRRYLGHQLDLGPGIDEVEAGFDSATRRAIRKAEKEGVEVSVQSDPAAMEAYYGLHRRTRRRHGLPPQPARFFRAIQHHLIDAGLGKVVLARADRDTIAGAVFLHSGDRAVYKFGASDTAHWQLRPNQAVMATAIRHLVATGHRRLHFGRTSPSDQGLDRFKRSWGARAHELSYHRFHSGSRTWLGPRAESLESHPALFGHLPLSLNQLAGSLIYPHLD